MIEPSSNKANSPEVSQLQLFGIGIILAQFILVALTLHQLDILPANFRRVIYLAIPAFLVNHILPANRRLLFFAIFSVCGLYASLSVPVLPNQVFEFGALPRATLVLAIGVGLIGICHLPFGFWIRTGMLMIAAVILAAFRVGIFPSNNLEITWIVVPMIFMFRIVIYLYDVATSPKKPDAAQSIAYFFLFPVALFTQLVPIIDFKTFCRSHYSESPLNIYQRGLRWITRGIIQLLLYRYVSEVFSIEFSEVSNGTELIRYLAISPLFYLNVSGHFHVIVGLLLLFGFNLPETNHHYFLASSFTDLWRRINIYWKDFTMKVFYYPTYFRLKKLGATPALVISTLWIFVLSWAFHIYFTFWASGTIRTSWKHLFFWLLFGSCVLMNSLWEMRPGRKRSIASSATTLSGAFWTTMRTALTFTAVWILLDPFGNSPSVVAWIGLWKHADWHTLIGFLGLILIVMAAKIVMEILPAWRKEKNPVKPAKAGSSPNAWRRDLIFCAGPLSVLCIVGTLAAHIQMPDFGLKRLVPRLNIQRFYDLLEAGDSLIPESSVEELNRYKNQSYYHEANRQLDEVFIGRRIPRYSQEGKAPVREVDDYRGEVLETGVQRYAYETADFRTNRWGMRNREYELAKPANTRRVALLGSAETMGYGVREEETFGSIVEEQLNRTETFGRWEVLNFAHVSYSPLAQIEVLRGLARQFTPDVVVFAGQLSDFGTLNGRLRVMQRQGKPIPDDFLTNTLTEARVIRYINLNVAEKRLRPYESALMDWTLTKIASECRVLGAVPVYYLIPPSPADQFNLQDVAARMEQMKELATKAGFVVVDGSHLFDEENLTRIFSGRVTHYTPRAHNLIANELLKRLHTDIITSTGDKRPVPAR